MKKIRNLLLPFIAVCAFSLNFLDITTVKAATKEDVIAAAKSAGVFSESEIQNGINYLELGSHTSEEYDRMINKIAEETKKRNDAIKDKLDNSSSAAGTPSQPAVTTGAAVQQPVENASDNTVSQPAASGNQSTVLSGIIDKYASMTPEEKKEYIEGMSVEEKKEIIKNLDKDKQMEIINGVIDVGSEFGMNITVDGLTDNSLTYSVRDNDGEIVDISSVGVIVDDTGIDYTKFIVITAAVIVMASAGIAAFAVMQKKALSTQSDDRRDS